VLLAKYYQGDQVEEDEICMTCGSMRWQNDIKKKKIVRKYHERAWNGLM
jgi:hypothetical protein